MSPISISGPPPGEMRTAISHHEGANPLINGLSKNEIWLPCFLGAGRVLRSSPRLAASGGANLRANLSRPGAASLRVGSVRASTTGFVNSSACLRGHSQRRGAQCLPSLRRLGAASVGSSVCVASMTLARPLRHGSTSLRGPTRCDLGSNMRSGNHALATRSRVVPSGGHRPTLSNPPTLGRMRASLRVAPLEQLVAESVCAVLTDRAAQQPIATGPRLLHMLAPARGHAVA